MFLVVAFAGCSKLPFGGQKQAALQVNSTPSASVYLNGNHVGQTPYFDDKIKPGEYTVRILVENDPTKDWQTKVNLQPQIITVINRLFGATADDSANYQLQLEALPNKDAIELSVITIPNNVIVKLDNQPEGFSPLSIKDVTEGDHAITLTAPGYQEMNIQAQTKKGYKLVVSATLAKAPEALANDTSASSSAALTATPTPTGKLISPTPKVTGKATPTPTKKPTSSSTASSSAILDRPYVVIKDTPTGWLKVRQEGNSTATEITKVNPGEKYTYLEANDSGWYKITLTNGDEGWISSKYAELNK